MTLCDTCNQPFTPTHGRMKRHVECRRRANSISRLAAYHRAHVPFAPLAVRPIVTEPVDIYASPDDIVRHPWTLDGLLISAGTALYITRAVYDTLRDERSLRVKESRRA